MTPQEAIARLEDLARHEKWKIDNIHDAPALREDAEKAYGALCRGINAIRVIEMRVQEDARDRRHEPRARWDGPGSTGSGKELIQTEGAR